MPKPSDGPVEFRQVTAAAMRAVAHEPALTVAFAPEGSGLRGTEARLPTQPVAPSVLRVGQREIELRELSGHTASDLVLIDRASGVVFAGGLAFADRVPTTPHAELPKWQASLRALAALELEPHGGRAFELGGVVVDMPDALEDLDTEFRGVDGFARPAGGRV